MGGVRPTQLCCSGPWRQRQQAAFGNTGEKLIATIMVLLSGVVWSQLIGVLCGVATNLNPLKQAFRKGTH